MCSDHTVVYELIYFLIFIVYLVSVFFSEYSEALNCRNFKETRDIKVF